MSNLLYCFCKIYVKERKKPVDKTVLPIPAFADDAVSPWIAFPQGADGNQSADTVPILHRQSVYYWENWKKGISLTMIGELLHIWQFLFGQADKFDIFLTKMVDIFLTKQ